MGSFTLDLPHDADVEDQILDPRSITSKILGTLSRLELSISLWLDEFTDAWVVGEPRESLLGAINVEHLHIKIHGYGDSDVDYDSTFQWVFLGCSFPHLKTFTLKGCPMLVDEVTELLLRSGKIEDLTLNDCSLIDATWEDLIKSMFEKTSVKWLSLRNVDGSKKGYHDISVNSLNEGLESLFNNGRNP